MKMMVTIIITLSWSGLIGYELALQMLVAVLEVFLKVSDGDTISVVKVIAQIV